MATESKIFRHIPQSCRLASKRLSAFLSLCVAPFLCTSGVTAVEFAIIMPVLILLLMGGVEFSIIMYASDVVEGATVSAARAGRTGYPINGDRNGYVRGVLNDRVGGLLDTSRVMMASQSYTGYGTLVPIAYCKLDQPCPNQDLGSARSEVYYTVSYPWKIMTPGLASIIGDGSGLFYIASSAIVKNEPWDATLPTDPATFPPTLPPDVSMSPAPTSTSTPIPTTPIPTTPAPSTTTAPATPVPTGTPEPTSPAPTVSASTPSPTMPVVTDPPRAPHRRRG